MKAYLVAGIVVAVAVLCGVAVGLSEETTYRERLQSLEKIALSKADGAAAQLASEAMVLRNTASPEFHELAKAVLYAEADATPELKQQLYMWLLPQLRLPYTVTLEVAMAHVDSPEPELAATANQWLSRFEQQTDVVGHYGALLRGAESDKVRFDIAERMFIANSREAAAWLGRLEKPRPEGVRELLLAIDEIESYRWKQGLGLLPVEGQDERLKQALSVLAGSQIWWSKAYSSSLPAELVSSAQE